MSTHISFCQLVNRYMCIYINMFPLQKNKCIIISIYLDPAVVHVIIIKQVSLCSWFTKKFIIFMLRIENRVHNLSVYMFLLPSTSFYIYKYPSTCIYENVYINVYVSMRVCMLVFVFMQHFVFEHVSHDCTT